VVNFTSLSLAATCRIRASACCNSARSCVRELLCSFRFLLAEPLPSTASANRGAPRSLFGSFRGTTGSSEFPLLFIIGLPLLGFLCGSRGHPPRPVVGSHGFRAQSFGACSGSATPRDPARLANSGARGVAFRQPGQRRHPEWILFRSSIPGPRSPLSTLRAHPCGCACMTRGQSESLRLLCMELSSTTLCRLGPAHPGRQTQRAKLSVPNSACQTQRD